MTFGVAVIQFTTRARQRPSDGVEWQSLIFLAGPCISRSTTRSGVSQTSAFANIVSQTRARSRWRRKGKSAVYHCEIASWGKRSNGKSRYTMPAVVPGSEPWWPIAVSPGSALMTPDTRWQDRSAKGSVLHTGVRV